MQVEYFGVGDGPRNLEVDLGVKDFSFRKIPQKINTPLFRTIFVGEACESMVMVILFNSVLNQHTFLALKRY